MDDNTDAARVESAQIPRKPRSRKPRSRKPQSSTRFEDKSAKTPSQLRSNARQVALRALVKSESDDAPLSSLLDQQPINDASRSFARELATGTTRHRARLDWTIAPFLKKPIEKLDAPVRAALRLAAYERIVLQTPHAVVADQYAELMKSEKLKSAVAFINAVARKIPVNWRVSPSFETQPVQFLSIEYSHPQWIIERWIANFGLEKSRDLCAANNEIAPLCLRVNTTKTTRLRVLDSLKSRGLDASAGELSPDAIWVEGANGSPESWPEWKRGEIIAQDEAAQLVAFVVAPPENGFVVDMASAPGGKTTHLAQLMKNRGHIWARDRSEGRLKLVRQNAARLGLTNIQTQAVDGRAVDGRESSTRSDDPTLDDPTLDDPTLDDPTLGDALLLDAPCLGTGTLRRRPDAKWRKTPQMLSELVELQRELLDAAATKVRVGGVLVYSTCSLESEENEDQIAAFLARHTNWKIDDDTRHEVRPEVAVLRGADGFWRTVPGISNEENGALSDTISTTDDSAKPSLSCFSLPDGMFAARLRRFSGRACNGNSSA